MSKYSHHNNELTINSINQQVSLKGWVAKKRNLGGLIFIDLKDRFGITQIVCHPEFKDYELCNQIKGEYVIEVSGVVAKRQTSNPGLTTGEIEVVASNITILNTAQTPPIGTSDGDDSLEDTRLKYRYLDLRKPKQQQFLIKRHHITQAARQSLIKQGFYELETPMLGKSTPEGARDYLVPSRLYHKQFYALPQSPQIYKQLFMIAGFERYFQFARCFRDEDLRADRQPEFTQIDIEASFVDSDDVMAIGEKMIASIFKECLNKKLKLPLKRITYQEALDKYGSDKPDLRYQLLIGDYYKNFKKVPLFENLAVIRGIKCNLNPIFTRKKIDSYTELVKKNNGKMLAYLKRENDELGGSIAKFVKKAPLKNNEILFLVAGNYDNTTQALGALRRELASDLGLIDDSVDNLLWVTDWPLLEYDPSLERYFAMHHPFTAPQVDEQLVNSPDKALAKAYDMVWNGYEIGGGSIRIHNQEIQNQMFNKLGFSDEDIKAKFGFFVDALKYGTPPHGGIAFGLDRICMLACRTTNIKDVIAFPKTQSAKDLMMDCPSSVLAEQLSELGIKND